MQRSLLSRVASYCAFSFARGDDMGIFASRKASHESRGLRDEDHFYIPGIQIITVCNFKHNTHPC